MDRCAWCRRPLSPGERRHVPTWIAYVAAVALAFVHAGMWAKEGLSEPFCARCRAKVIPIALGVAALALSLAAVGAMIWLRGP